MILLQENYIFIIFENLQYSYASFVIAYVHYYNFQTQKKRKRCLSFQDVARTKKHTSNGSLKNEEIFSKSFNTVTWFPLTGIPKDSDASTAQNP